MLDDQVFERQGVEVVGLPVIDGRNVADQVID